MPNSKVRQPPRKGKIKMNTIKNSAKAVGLLYGVVGIVGLLNISYVPADPSHTVMVWLAVSSVLEALVSANEMVGGLWLFLVTWGACLAGRLPQRLNTLGMVTGVAGILTAVPALQVLETGFELGEMVWLVWLGIVFIQAQPHNNRLHSCRAILDSGIRRCRAGVERAAYIRPSPPIVMRKPGEKL